MKTSKTIISLLGAATLFASSLKAQETDWMAMDVTCNIENKDVRRYLAATLKSSYYNSESYSNYSIVGQYLPPDNVSYEQDDPALLPVPQHNEPLTLTVFDCADDASLSQGGVFCTQAIPVGSDTVAVHNLIPGRTYSYMMQSPGGEVVSKGLLHTEGLVRMFGLPTVHNLRDIGGWTAANGMPLAYGKIFRGSELRAGYRNNASDEDIEALRSLGMGAELDMRNVNYADTSAFGRQTPYLYIYMLDNGMQFRDYKPEYAEAFRFLLHNLREGRGVYIHCTYGADRTGLFLNLIEGLLGMSLGDMYREYEMTSLSRYVVGQTGYPQVMRNKTLMNKRMSYMEYENGSTYPKTKIQELTRSYAINQLGLTEEELDEFLAVMTDPDYVYDGIVTPEVKPWQRHGVYNLSGMRTSAVHKGIKIIRREDGTVRKTL